MFIEWDDKYSVGVKKFDDQHKKLFALLNEFDIAIREKKGKMKMGAVIEELIDYAFEHLGAEEHAMEELGYPDYENHKVEHDRLTAQVKDFHARYSAGDPLMTIELLGFVARWLEKHIMETDQQYTAFFSEKGVH